MHRAYCTWRATVAAPGRGPSAETGIRAYYYVDELHAAEGSWRALPSSFKEVAPAFEKSLPKRGERPLDLSTGMQAALP